MRENLNELMSCLFYCSCLQIYPFVAETPAPEVFPLSTFLTAHSSLGLTPIADFNMLRRKPTRLELKLDDIEEFESIRKDLEVRIHFPILRGISDSNYLRNLRLFQRLI